MNAELTALEDKIEQVLALVKQLRAENDVLKNQLATVDHERLNLRTAMDSARERLTGLVDQLPENPLPEEV